MTRLTTDAESRVLDLLTEAWRQYLALPVEHEDAVGEFRAGVHRLQDLVGARPAWRAEHAAGVPQNAPTPHRHPSVTGRRR